MRVTSAEENTLVFDLIKKANVKGAWINGSDESLEGRWKYVNGDPVRYFQWASGEGVDNSKRRDQHHIIMGTAGNWFDDPAGLRAPFVCEWPSREEQLK